ncbi:glucuronate isomerase [Pseudolysinimonas sp.]|uniref:glucuronate isomerase n=1 Tax=Pseudolysinimonas sp. TaxID=2680009 RepID=UPI003F7CEE78
MAEYRPDPDRLLPADPRTREVARGLYARVAGLPILSPHGHVPAASLADDEPFGDPASLLVRPDHYVTRLLHADGADLAELDGHGGEGARRAWRLFCRHWPVFAGTASGYWLEHELGDLFGIGGLDEATADATFDRIAEQLARPDFRPQALLRRFGIEFLATTDDPLDPLDDHRRLRDDPDVATRVAPTFRPDAYLDAGSPGWAARVDRLLAASDGDADGPGEHGRYLGALRRQRRRFIDAGAVSADHSVTPLGTLRLERAEAAALFDRLRAGAGDAADVRAFQAHMIYEMARMSVDDGLVMTLHPGVVRDHHPATRALRGSDSGHDIPVAAEFTQALRPLLSSFGTAAGFRLVLFTLDETVFSRELAPLAGFYPSVYLGSPWWFLDAPDAMLRFRAAVTETAGFSRSAGFVDDTRGFCSIPVRHDTARRVEAAFLARLVVEARLTEERAGDIIVDLVDGAPRRVFGIG